MKKILPGLIGLISVFILVSVTLPAWAAPNPNSNQQIPEIDGTYNEPGNPNVKVRVIVHRVRSDQQAGPSISYLQCGLSDPESSDATPVAGWKLPSSVTYRLNPASVPSAVGGVNLPTIAQNGFTDWNVATNNKVVFTKGSDTSVSRQAYDGQNVITWGRTSGSALAVTYIRYNTVTKIAVDVDTIFNKSFVWSWSSEKDCAWSNAYDAENILTHELGHWIGLGDAYDNSYANNTMYGYGSKQEVKKNTLTAGDVTGARQIYP